MMSEGWRKEAEVKEGERLAGRGAALAPILVTHRRLAVLCALRAGLQTSAFVVAPSGGHGAVPRGEEREASGLGGAAAWSSS